MTGKVHTADRAAAALPASAPSTGLRPVPRRAPMVQQPATNPMAARRKTKATKATEARGAKVKFLAVLPADAIKELKLEGIRRGTTASSVLEEAVASWMKAHRHSQPKSLDKESGEKRQFLSQMDAGLVRDLKILAMDWRVTASTIVGRAVADWSRAERASRRS
jgi:hypothetical protein